MKAAPREAEACFARALDLARTSQAKSLELRAATSLARAWAASGRGAEGRNVLREICAWFGDVDSADLIVARKLLGRLETAA